MIDSRNTIGGNIYTERIDGIDIHKYGAHIFHTSDDIVWKFVNKYTTFNNYINMPIANYLGRIYNLPFNMHTFTQIFSENNISNPEIAKQYIESLRIKNDNPQNLEEQALSLVGKKIYEYLIKGYTEKQWGKDCKDLPASIIKRIPLRFTYNNNYFNDKYQGIPIDGYTNLIRKLINGAKIILNHNYNKNDYNLADRIYYSGQIDKYYDYKLGTLEYRRIKIQIRKITN